MLSSRSKRPQLPDASPLAAGRGQRAAGRELCAGQPCSLPCHKTPSGDMGGVLKRLQDCIHQACPGSPWGHSSCRHAQTSEVAGTMGTQAKRLIGSRRRLSRAGRTAVALLRKPRLGAPAGAAGPGAPGPAP